MTFYYAITVTFITLTINHNKNQNKRLQQQVYHLVQQRFCFIRIIFRKQVQFESYLCTVTFEYLLVQYQAPINTNILHVDGLQHI